MSSTVTWTASLGGNFASPDDWSSGRVPGAADIIDMARSDPQSPVSVTAAETVAGLAGEVQIAVVSTSFTVLGAQIGTGEVQLYAGDLAIGGPVSNLAVDFFGASTLTIANPAAADGVVALDYFDASDRVDLAGVAVTGITAAPDGYGDGGASNSEMVFTYTEGSATGSLSLDFQPFGSEQIRSFAPSDFILCPDGAGGTMVAADFPCFAAGTRLLTPAGERAVETLNVGEMVVTASGQHAPIVWIGHRRVDFTIHPEPERARPIRIAAHAFGPGQPHRDLLLSPEHAIFTEGVLIPVYSLVNGHTIRQDESFPRLQYFHVELATHDVILAEGLPVESYLDTGNRAAFANNPLIMLHADFGEVEIASPCAPLMLDGELVEAVRARLQAIAERGPMEAALVAAPRILPFPQR